MSYRYWQCKNDSFYFGYTPQKQFDGKFHAVKMRRASTIKDIAFGRRKVAKARAYQWYCKRKAVLEKRNARKKPKPILSKQDQKKANLKLKIRNAQMRMRKLLSLSIIVNKVFKCVAIHRKLGSSCVR